MKKMKPWVCLALAIGLLLSMTACSGDGNVTSDSSPESIATMSSASADATAETTVQSPNTTAGSSTAAQKTTTKNTPSKVTQPSSYNASTASNLTRDQVMAKFPAKLKNTTIKYLGGGDMTQGIWGSAIKEFEKKTGVKLVTEVCGVQEINTTLAARISANNSPDLVNMTEAFPYICKNLQPITNLGYDFNDKNWDWDIMKDYTFNGKTYSMQVKNTPFTPVSVILYNKSALRRAEMEDMDPFTIWKNNPADWTWDKFFSLCDTFLKRNGNKDGYYGGAFGAFYEAYIKAQGFATVYYDTVKMKYVCALKDANYVKAWETTVDALNKKYLSAAASENEFKMGRALFYWDWNVNLQTGNTYHSELKRGNNLGVVPIPTDSKKQVMYWQHGHGVPIGAQNSEVVPYFIRYIQDRRSYDLTTFYNVENALDVVEYSISQGSKNKNFFAGQGIYNYNFSAQMESATPGR